MKHLQIEHDTAMTKLQTSLMQKEEDFVALMTKAEEYKSKRQKYHELNRKFRTRER